MEENKPHWLDAAPELTAPIQIVIEIPDDVLEIFLPAETLRSHLFSDTMDNLLGAVPISDQDQLMKDRHFQEELQHEFVL